MVVTVPTGSDVAYTQYAEVSLNENVDLIVAEGDDFVTDILGLSTSGISTLTGIGGRIRVERLLTKQEQEHHNLHLVLRFQLVMD